MKISRINWMSLFVVVLTFAVAYWYYPQLPEQVPTHWNIKGEVDGWTEKPWGVYMVPLISLATAVVLMLLPSISPKGFRLDNARKAYDAIIFVVVCFMAAISIASYQAALDGDFPMDRIITSMIGVLFIVIGNYLGKFPKNFFVGIKTPWTLASDEVWNRTHRLGGWTFMLAGLVAILAAVFGLPMWVFVTTVVLASLIPVIYSLILYKRLHGFDKDET